MSSNKSILNKTEVVDICSFCQKNFKPPNFESIFCDGCKTWIHLSCSGLSKHNFNFYSYNSDLFYCKYCAKKFEFKVVGTEDFCKNCFKRFTSNDKCVYCEGCFKWIHYKCVSIPKENFNKICKNDLPFFCETCSLKISVCYKCNSVCKNSKNCLTCFLCNNKCHFKCATEKNVKKGDYKFYCDRCKESVFPFQNVDNFDCDCFYKSVKPIIPEKKKQRALLRFLGYPWFKEHVFYLLNLF